MWITMYQVDAFTDRVFGGNPAAVCVLDQWLSEATMQAIARENNLSETAFVIDRGEHFDLRWFTPEAEIDLAGHPTLATAHVIFEHLKPGLGKVRFVTQKSGHLYVTKHDGRLHMDFPTRPGQPVSTPPAELLQILGGAPVETLLSRDLMAVVQTPEQVLALDPDQRLVARLPGMGLIVTAPGADCDFVSRFFTPEMGIPEDPVTGSAHCTLIPYWAKRLGKEDLLARQVSARGGVLWCQDRGARVGISGQAVLYMEARIHI